MGEAHEQPIYEVVWRTRRLFQRLAVAWQELDADSDMTAAERAVLEFLYRDDGRSVPQMARERNVSRQHIQTLVNGLLERGLVSADRNPSHRRSPLIRLTANGRRRFERLLRVEARILRSLGRAFQRSDLETTARTLGAIEAYLATPKWQALAAEARRVNAKTGEQK